MDASIRTSTGVVALRDLQPEDIEHIVRFWYGSGDEFLEFLGIDRARLGTPEDTRQRFNCGLCISATALSLFR
jgi:hypothetical protein